MTTTTNQLNVSTNLSLVNLAMHSQSSLRLIPKEFLQSRMSLARIGYATVCIARLTRIFV